jgi:hypothetical protein
MQLDVTTFFDTDLPALLAWQFAAGDARRILAQFCRSAARKADHGSQKSGQLILRWFPDAEDVLIHGADHSLEITHTVAIADALTTFLRQNPIGA